MLHFPRIAATLVLHYLAAPEKAGAKDVPSAQARIGTSKRRLNPMEWARVVKIGAAVAKAHLFGVRTPLAVWVDITNRCPANCAYCNLSRTGEKDLPLEDVLRLADEAREAGTQRMHLSGGDPLMRDDIGEIIRHIKGRGLYLTLSVREHFIPARINALAGVDYLFLSFEGPEEVHDGLKGRGSFRHLLRAFEILKEHGIPFLTTTILTKRNAPHIDYILETARKYDFRCNFQCLHYPQGIDQPAGFQTRHPLEDLLLSDEEYRRAGETLLRRRKEGAPVISSPESIRYAMLKWPDHRQCFLPSLVDRRVKCWAGKLFCMIDIDGSVYHCGSTFIDRKDKRRYLDFRKVGFARAFRNLGDIPCRACIQACHTELNLMFSLHPSTIGHWLKQFTIRAGG